MSKLLEQELASALGQVDLKVAHLRTGIDRRSEQLMRLKRIKRYKRRKKLLTKSQASRHP